MENSISNALASIERTSSTFANGNAAVEAMKSSSPLIFVSDRILAEGDVVTIPRLDGATEDELKQWLNTPVIRGGDPVPHCLAKVENNGRTRYLEVFLGSFFKQVRNRETSGLIESTVVYRDGSTPAWRDCPSKYEQWRLLAGRTFRIEKVERVPVQKRSRTTMQLYDADATIATIKEV